MQAELADAIASQRLLAGQLGGQLGGTPRAAGRAHGDGIDKAQLLRSK